MKYEKKTLLIIFLISIMVFSTFAGLLVYSHSIKITKFEITSNHTIYPGDKVKIEATIENQFPFDINEVVNLYVGKQKIDHKKIVVLSRDSANVSLFWTPEKEGNYVIKVVVGHSESKTTIRVNTYSNKNKFALALYHFNLQYKAGNIRIEDRIITDSLAPLLKMYEAHETWKGDIEIQAYALEVMNTRHPEVLELLKKLVDRRQIELIVPYYSDQFLLAFPEYDMQKSLEISDAIVNELDIIRSNVVFTQESQWSPAFPRFFNKNGFETIIVSQDAFDYYSKEELKNPLYSAEFDGRTIDVLLTKKGNTKDLDWIWTWDFDGELVNTDAINFRFQEEKMKRYEKEIEKAESMGYTFVTANEYVYTLKEKNIQPVDLPQIPEGTWITSMTNGVYLWMGWNKRAIENDAEILTLLSRTRQRLLVADTLIEIAEKNMIDISTEKKDMIEAWKFQLLAEGSDSLGWAAAPYEVQFSTENRKRAESIAEKVIYSLKEKLGYNDSQVYVNTYSNVISETKEIEESEIIDNPFDFRISGGSSSVLVTKIHMQELMNSSIFIIDIKIEVKKTSITIKFEMEDEKVVWKNTTSIRKPPITYSPALAEDTRITFQPEQLRNNPTLPLSNGLISLGESIFLIRYNTVRYGAVYWDKDQGILLFQEDNNLKDETILYRFAIINGTLEDAHKMATLTNIHPTLIV